MDLMILFGFNKPFWRAGFPGNCVFRFHALTALVIKQLLMIGFALSRQIYNGRVKEASYGIYQIA